MLTAAFDAAVVAPAVVAAAVAVAVEAVEMAAAFAAHAGGMYGQSSELTLIRG